MTMFHPEQVRDGRDRILQGERRPEYERTPRPYFCRGCGEQQTSVLVPRGWYTLLRAPGNSGQRPARLGLYCSMRCIGAQMEHLVGIEDDQGDEFDRRPSAFRQRPTW